MFYIGNKIWLALPVSCVTGKFNLMGVLHTLKYCFCQDTFRALQIGEEGHTFLFALMRSSVMMAQMKLACQEKHVEHSTAK